MRFRKVCLDTISKVNENKAIGGNKAISGNKSLQTTLMCTID